MAFLTAPDRSCLEAASCAPPPKHALTGGGPYIREARQARLVESWMNEWMESYCLDGCVVWTLDKCLPHQEIHQHWLAFCGRERERDCIEQGPRQKLFFPGLDLSRPWDSSPGTLFYGAGTIDQYEW